MPCQSRALLYGMVDRAALRATSAAATPKTHQFVETIGRSDMHVSGFC